MVNRVDENAINVVLEVGLKGVLSRREVEVRTAEMECF